MTRRAHLEPLPHVTVRGPADLAHLVPYLLGFHPHESLVLVGLDGSKVIATARLDLVDAAPVTGLVPHTLAALSRGGASRFVALVYADDADDSADDNGAGHVHRSDGVHEPLARHSAGDDREDGGGELPWSWLAEQVAYGVASAGGDLDDVALVSGGRLYSYRCASADCCPPEGRALDPCSQIAAEATYAGLVALPDRRSVAAVLEPAPEGDRERLVPMLHAGQRDAARSTGPAAARSRRSDTRALFAACRCADAGADVLTDDQLVRFAVALADVDLRDAAWVAVDQERIDGRMLWVQLARRLPSPWDAPALFLFGWATFRDGDGALAGMAAERALASDPSYSAADLLMAALASGVDPRRLPRLRTRRSA